MKVVIIGGTGLIGTYLVPKLVTAGHKVVCVSRQKSRPYIEGPAWQSVERVAIDRVATEEKGNFGKRIRELRGEVVIDLICFTPRSATLIADALLGEIEHFIHCGSIWVHGHSERVPTLESQERKPFGTYGINKATIESDLLGRHRENGFPVTVLHPGHITGPGRPPINPVGNLDPEIFVKLALGQEVVLPNLGMETLHHVHVDDVAQAFVRAIENQQNAFGESFHVVSEQALTLRGYAIAVAKWFDREANLSFQPWEICKKDMSRRNSELTWDHIAHSPNGSIAKTKKLLNYRPFYTSLQAVREALHHYAIHEDIAVLKKME